jgi:hypothetical protein
MKTNQFNHRILLSLALSLTSLTVVEIASRNSVQACHAQGGKSKDLNGCNPQRFPKVNLVE